MNEQSLNPQNVIVVLKHGDKEVGRIAATASNATAYMNELVRHYGELSMEYEEDKDAAMISRMLSPVWGRK